MNDTPEIKAVENDAKATVAAAATATEEVLETGKKVVENAGHSYLHELLAWVKAKFDAIGLDIKTELEKL